LDPHSPKVLFLACLQALAQHLAKRYVDGDFSFGYVGFDGRPGATQLLTAFAFVERTYSFKEEFLSQGRQYSHARKRIGFVSGDLCVHAVGLLLAELIEGIDRSKNEVVAYDFSPEDGTAHRTRLKNAFDHVRSIHTLTDRQVAEQVLEDEIDVLIDLHGLSSGARPGIFALHPAPRQGTYLGFIGTTGMPWFDFVIADLYALPQELAQYFTEKPLHVEGSFIPLDAR
jgi:predicted O-linked N-acetylglucosamine transferase (SPINDLY family)